MNDATSTNEAAMYLPDATLEMLTRGATSVALCATLIPAITVAMRGLQAGQILAVQVDDPAAHEDIAAWCRLTGHGYLRADEIAPQRWQICIRKYITGDHEED